MTTRAKNKIHKPIQKLNLTATITSTHQLELHTVIQAFKDPKWHQAMFEQYDALVRNGTCELVPPDSTQNLVGCKWIFKI